MRLPEEAELLRIFVGESDKRGGRPVYELIVHESRRRGLAGATVLRATMGFGAHSSVHSAKVLRLSEDLSPKRKEARRRFYLTAQTPDAVF